MFIPTVPFLALGFINMTYEIILMNFCNTE